MKIFIKWSLAALIFLSGVALFAGISEGFDKSRTSLIIISILTGSVLLGYVFFLTEKKYIPWRKKKIVNKMINLFNARQVSESICTFNMQGMDFFASIKYNLVMSNLSPGTEQVSFHVPRIQIDKHAVKPDFEYIPDSCNEIPTYVIYQTNGYGLSRARNAIIKGLTEVDH